MFANMFRAHGHFCSSHPLEVIVIALISTICILSTCCSNYARPHCSLQSDCSIRGSKVSPAKTEIVLMTLAQCMALLCIYHQFKKLWKLGSKYVLSVTSIFTVFSCIVFCSSIIFILGGTMSDLVEALPFFFLMIDLPKAGRFTQIALKSSSHRDVRRNIANGMSELGPALTLDSVVAILAIGIGTLSGVRSLEIMSSYACLAAIVNYFVFLTFLPSCLSLALELTKGKLKSENTTQESEQKPNPALQRVKVIMSAGLMLVHAHCRWILPSNDETVFGQTEKRLNADVQLSVEKKREIENLDNFLYKWFNITPNQLVFVGLTVALLIKYVFYENHDDPPSQISTNVSKRKASRSRLRKNSNEENDTPGALQSDNSAVQQRTRNKIDRTTSFIISDEGVHETISPTPAEVKTEEFESLDKQTVPEVAVNLNEKKMRDISKCLEIYKTGNVKELTDEEIIMLVDKKHIPGYKLEEALHDCLRGVIIRRKLQAEKVGEGIHQLPFENFNYDKVAGACCENVIGYMPVPVGMAGPMLLDGVNYHVPMATTEGCLVASTNRGFRALLSGSGIFSKIVADGMSRAPVVRFPNAQRAAEVMAWLKVQENFQIIKAKFESTSRFSKLLKLQVRIAGRYLFIRFVATTGDAMGMNMVSKGTEASLSDLQLYFSDMEVLSLSGNYCSDKKPAAVNWIEGRGKSVVCEAVIPENIVNSVLKTNVQSLVDVNISKNLIGSAIAGSIGGYNAQAANIVAAIFIATGQDPAQVVASSNCITLIEPAGPEGKDLYITVTMPCLELGTIGGGTVLPAQAACLKMLGVQGSKANNPGQNARTLATIVCGAVLAGELSLISALSAGHLVQSHMRLNRSYAKVKSDPQNAENSL